MSHQRVGSLEIEQDLTFQYREWAAQRIAWVVMTLLIVAALLGIFATGPLSSTSATTSDGSLTADYGRFARHDAITTIDIQILPEAIASDEVRIQANQSFLDTWEIDGITPEPDSSELSVDGIIWTFAAGEFNGPGQIQLRVRPDGLFLGSGELGLADRQPLTIRQFIYP